MSASKQENVKWVDGLRGIASLLVVFTHLSRSFDPNLYKPCDAEGSFPRVVQYPIIRFFLQGRIGVPIFSLVTGYVCALKPVRLFATGNQEKALKSMTQSAFRRVPRLVLPASIATCLIWLVAQLGGFMVAKHVNSFWIMATSPNQLAFGPGVLNLFSNLISTWVRQWNGYEANQWTLLPLLKGAFLVYVLLFATAHVQARYRMMIELGMVVYYWIAHDAEYGIHFFFGAFLCDLSQLPSYTAWIQTRKWPSRFVSPILLLIGLIFASYPEQNPEWQPWSNGMHDLAAYIFPPKHPDTPRFYTGSGLLFIAVSIQFSELFKTILSHKYLLFAGKVSFAVYLLHGTFLRTVLVWMMYGISVPPDTVLPNGTHLEGNKLQVDHWIRYVIFIPLWFVFTYYVANQWMNHVDPWCARMTQKLEKYVIKEEEEKSVLPQ